MYMRGCLQDKVWFAALTCTLLWSVPGLSAQSDGRFTLVMNGAAVKDNQTGLIWEQEPDREHDVWSRSNERCAAKDVGGQKGWRGPTVEELKTLDEYTRSQGRHRGLAGELFQRRTGHGSEIGYPPDVVCTDPSVEVRGSMSIESFPIPLPFPDIR